MGKGMLRVGGLKSVRPKPPDPIPPTFKLIPNLFCFSIALAAGIKKIFIGVRGSRNVCVWVIREAVPCGMLGQVFPPLLGFVSGLLLPTALHWGGTGGRRTPVPRGSQHLCVFKCRGQTEQICTQGSIVILRRRRKRKIHCKVSGAPLQLPCLLFFPKREGRSREKPHILKCPHLLLLPGGGSGVNKPGSNMV